MFLRPHEAKLMKRDFYQLLRSAEAVPVTVQYRKYLDPSVVDPVYGGTSSEISELQEIKTTVIQKIVGPRDREILDWGVLSVGDCILYFSDKLDLTEADVAHTIFQIDELEWIPIPEHDLKESKEYAIFRTAFGQVAQVIPCKQRPLAP